VTISVNFSGVVVKVCKLEEFLLHGHPGAGGG